MGLENRLKASNIVEKAGMDDRPSFYSGRGATLTDLDSERLERIYTEIKSVHGKNAAEEFVSMVGDMPKLSATDFLETIYMLESNDWKWDRSLLRNSRGVCADQNMACNFATIAGVVYGMNDRDETTMIRGEFLKKHDYEWK